MRTPASVDENHVDADAMSANSHLPLPKFEEPTAEEGVRDMEFVI